MKLIPLRATGNEQSKTILTAILSTSPESRINIDEMRRRCRILDLLDDAEAEIAVEDSDYDILKKAIETFPFAMANRELLAILDDVLNAKEPGKASG